MTLSIHSNASILSPLFHIVAIYSSGELELPEPISQETAFVRYHVSLEHFEELELSPP
jgi:hypothetical protein